MMNLKIKSTALHLKIYLEKCFLSKVNKMSFILDAIFHKINAQLQISAFNINITRFVCLLDISTYLAHLTHKSVWLDFKSCKKYDPLRGATLKQIKHT